MRFLREEFENKETAAIKSFLHFAQSLLAKIHILLNR